MVEKEFKINEYLKLKQENGETVIYVGGEPFRQCKYLLIDEITGEDVPDYQRQIQEVIEEMQYTSIDEKAKQYKHDLEKKESFYFHIFPEEEFWAHCSNLQAWTENNYNTDLLHHSIAFPLLKELSKLGDSIIKKRLSEEIVKKFTDCNFEVLKFLLKEKYYKNLEKQEFDLLLTIIGNNEALLNQFLDYISSSSFLFKKDLHNFFTEFTSFFLGKKS